MAFISSFTGITVRSATNNRAVCNAAPRRAAKWTMNDEGKGFGGGEATRDPAPTEIDPKNPKAKQTAIHPAETFAEYQARMKREAEEKKGQ